MTRRRVLLSLAAAALVATPAVAADILEVAADTGNLSMLLRAIEAAGLVETLKSDGPFTLFAPDDNNAFIEIEEGGYEEFLIDRPQLTATLTYLIVPGRVMSSDITEGVMATTLEGGKILLTRGDNGDVQVVGPYQGGPRMNGATVIAADIEASNGVVHVIDALISPPP